MKTMILRLASLVIIFSLLFSSMPFSVFATEDINIKATKDESSIITLGEEGGYLIGNLKTTNKLYADRKFSLRTGHGFAAENGNNLYDSLKGMKTRVVGDNNVKMELTVLYLIKTELPHLYRTNTIVRLRDLSMLLLILMGFISMLTVMVIQCN